MVYFKIPVLLAIWAESDPWTQELSSTVFPSKEFQHSTCKQRVDHKKFYETKFISIFFWNSIFVRKCITSTKFCCSTRLVIWATQWHEAVWTRLHLMSSILSQIWFHPTLPTFTFLCRLLCSSGRIDGRSFSLLNCSHCPELLPSVFEIHKYK